MPSPEDVEAALTNVIDPELGLDFVELGLIYGIEVSAGDVHVTFSLTSPGCPIGPQVSEQIEEFVTELDGVTSVESTMTFTPALDAGPDVRRREVRAGLLSPAPSRSMMRSALVAAAIGASLLALPALAGARAAPRRGHRPAVCSSR